MPKFNMYQSLHTTVIGPDGKPVEMQIRTRDDAPHRRVRHRRALEVQGEHDRRHAGRAAASDMAWLRQLLDWQRETADPGEFLESLRYDLGARGGLRVHAQGRRHHAAAGLDAGRLRLRGAHRGRPPQHRRPGQRPAGAAGVGAGQRRRRRGLHLQGPERRPDPGLARASSSARARNKIRQWFAKERREDAVETGKDAIARTCAAGPAAAAAGHRRRAAGDRHGTALPRRVRRSTPRSARTTSAPSRSSRLVSVRGRPAGARRTWPRPPSDPRPAGPRAADRRLRRRRVAGAPTSGPSWPSAAPRCPATRSWASSPAAAGYRAPHRLHQRRHLLQPSPSGSSGPVGAVAGARCSWSRSRSRRSTGTGCSPT